MKNLPSWILLVTTILLLSGNAAAQELMSLDEAVRIGLENNFSILIARNQSDIAANNNTLGNAGFFPTVSAQGTRTERIENTTFATLDTETSFTGAESQSTNASANLNWTIFDGTRMFITRDKLAELEHLSDRQLRLSIETYIAGITGIYYDIIRRKKTLEVLRNTVEISEERVRIAETKRDLGSGSEFDLLQARSDLNADRAAVIRQETLLNDAKVALNQQLSREVDTSYLVADLIPLEGELVYEQLVRQALAENPGLAVARSDQRVTELEIKEIQRERYPEIDLNVGYSYSRNESGGGFFQFNETDGLNYGITARINLFDGFDINRRAQNARIRLRNQQLAIEDQTNRIKAGLLSEYRSYQNSLRLVTLEEDNLDIAQQSMEIALERFKLGTISSIELREAQRTLIDAENRLIQARFEAKVAETELMRLSGKLTERR
ncbi:MAG: TolC family protein [Balneolaceae bacterium]|nr:TolC family protein [Balneolaceae bacterium]